MPFHDLLKTKLASREEASKLISGQRLKGRKIVFTNGCFDLLHPGHVDYLMKARDLGQFLVLGLNSDDSVRRLNKAPDRPVNSESARAAVLAGLVCVDLIVIFNEDTPLELIKALRPDVLVKGNDWPLEKVVGYREVKESGGNVLTIPLLEGYSTTSLIEKLKR
jgi:rfaE bifunctional protein nucleotidyltransferase chain/domain